jgi:hypothetical protein
LNPLSDQEVHQPTVQEVRDRIENVVRPEYRLGLMADYLLDARISEIVAQASPGDNKGKEIARGPKGSDARLESFLFMGTQVPCVIFSIKTAKRGGNVRNIALPLEEQYEPWTKPLYEFFRRAGDGPVFNYNRQQIWYYIKKNGVFRCMAYPIDRYKVYDDSGVRKEVDKHVNPFALHALRHIRTTELVEFYGFDGFNLSIYGGWTLKTIAGVSSSMERYLSLSWSTYFPKLLKRRSDQHLKGAAEMPLALRPVFLRSLFEKSGE